MEFEITMTKRKTYFTAFRRSFKKFEEKSEVKCKCYEFNRIGMFKLQKLDSQRASQLGQKFRAVLRPIIVCSFYVIFDIAQK